MPAPSKIEQVPLTPQLRLIGALSNRLLAILHPAEGLFLTNEEMENVGIVIMQPAIHGTQDGLIVRTSTVTEALKKSIAPRSGPA